MDEKNRADSPALTKPQSELDTELNFILDAIEYYDLTFSNLVEKLSPLRSTTPESDSKEVSDDYRPIHDTSAGDKLRLAQIRLRNLTRFTKQVINEVHI